MQYLVVCNSMLKLDIQLSLIDYMYCCTVTSYIFRENKWPLFNLRRRIGTTESEVNEFMIIGLGMGILSMAFLAAILICHRKRKRKNHTEHPMLPSHAHFHTCESIGERFATSSSMDSVRVNTSAAHEYRIIAITFSILTYFHFFSGMTIEIVNECECHLPAAKILKKTNSC